MKKLSPLKQALPQIKADIVLSLGNNCRPASRLEEFDLRKEANPLDWMMSYDLKIAYDLMASDFKDFFTQCENLGKFNEWHLRVQDKKSAMQSIHHFNTKEPLEAQIKAFNEQSVRRWLKIKEKLRQSKNIVFVRNSDEALKEFALFLEKISKLLGEDKHYTFIKICHDKSKEFNELKITQYQPFAKATIITYEGNDESISELQADFWRGNSFLWAEVMKNIKLRQLHQKFGAVERVKNHLCYQFGEALNLSSNRLYTAFVLPFVLFYLYQKHQKYLKGLDELALPLSSYADYKEALKLQESLDYVLGQTLLQHLNFRSKNPLKIFANGGGAFELSFSRSA